MYKTDLDANLDSRFGSNLDNVSSRYHLIKFHQHKKIYESEQKEILSSRNRSKLQPSKIKNK